MLLLYLFLMSLPLELLVVSNPHTHLNSHQPQNVTGELEDSVTGQIIQKLITPNQLTFSIDISGLLGKAGIYTCILERGEIDVDVVTTIQKKGYKLDSVMFVQPIHLAARAQANTIVPAGVLN
jgi:hypothetical protein